VLREYGRALFDLLQATELAGDLSVIALLVIIVRATMKSPVVPQTNHLG
jgi:hypothetical protein